MKIYSLLILFNILLILPVIGQEITDLPENQRNTRFMQDPAIISVRPGLSIAGFSGIPEKGLGLQEILNTALETRNGRVYPLVSAMLEKANNPISMDPPIDQIEYTTNVMQYLAFEALASVILEQNGIDSGRSNNQYGLSIREHATVMEILKDALNSLTTNNKLVVKQTGNEPFDDYLNSIRSYNNMARAIDLYLGIENAYTHFGIDESLLLSESEKISLMDRFKSDIHLLFNEGIKKEYDIGGLISVTEDNLESGNRPLKGYFALAYASMGVQSAVTEDLDLLDEYISITERKASESTDNQRGRYWMHQTANGSRFWAEGPYYFDLVLKDALIFWHAVQINQEPNRSLDPFYNDWFLNPVRWLADLSTPDGSVPPLDDGNKRPIQSAKLLQWSEDYGDQEIGKIFTSISEKITEYHDSADSEDQFYLVETAIPSNDGPGRELQSVTESDGQQLVVRHHDSSNQEHYLALVGEKGASITSGEGHEQPDQLQLLYSLDQYSFLTDGGYDRGSPQSNSTWNGYVYTNTMQYNSKEIHTRFGFVEYQNEGGLESPFASVVETRKVSEHADAFINYQSPAPNVSILSGEVDLNFNSPEESISRYTRTILLIKGARPYLIDINDIQAFSGRNDYVMRYYGNSDHSSTENDWFVWEPSNQPFASPTHRMFLHTVPLIGRYSETEESILIQAYENRENGQEKIPYPVVRKSYVSDISTDRYTTLSILQILKQQPYASPVLSSDGENLRYLTYKIDEQTVDLIVFTEQATGVNRTLEIQSGSLDNIEISLLANQSIGFSRFIKMNENWIQDSDFIVNLKSNLTPEAPENLTVSIEEVFGEPVANLTWDKQTDNIASYEIWKQLRNRNNDTEQEPLIIGRSQTNSYKDFSLGTVPQGEFDQRWFVRAVNIDSLRSPPSEYTEWITFEPSSVTQEIEVFPPFPNPMQDSGRIRYQLAEYSIVTLQLFDMLGRNIKRIHTASQTAGTYTVEWENYDIASGIYILQINVQPESGSQFRKNILVSVIH